MLINSKIWLLFSFNREKETYSINNRAFFLSQQERKHYNSLMSHCNEWVFIKENTYKVRKLLTNSSWKQAWLLELVAQYLSHLRLTPSLSGHKFTKIKESLAWASQTTPPTAVSRGKEDSRSTYNAMKQNKDFLLVQKSPPLALDSEFHRKKKIYECYCLNTEYLEKLKLSGKS